MLLTCSGASAHLICTSLFTTPYVGSYKPVSRHFVLSLGSLHTSMFSRETLHKILYRGRSAVTCQDEAAAAASVLHWHTSVEMASLESVGSLISRMTIQKGSHTWKKVNTVCLHFPSVNLILTHFFSKFVVMFSWGYGWL